MSSGKTLLHKVWDAHTVRELPNGQSQLFIGLHLVHEVTSPQAFAALEERGLHVRFPERTYATVDHIIPTESQARPLSDAMAETMMTALERNCHEHGIQLFDTESGEQGIVHVIGPEKGLTQPGMTIACGDSHTSTHGAFGAFAFGIGTTEVGHVLATQSLLQQRPKTFEIHYRGELGRAVTAKDLILHTIGTIGVDGGTGHVIEYTGEPIRRLSMEGRMTVCNMSIEAGARAGMVAPDETTFEDLRGRPFAPADFDDAMADWKTLPSDPGAVYDRRVEIDASAIEPMLTWGTHPGTALPVTGRVPRADEIDEAQRPALERALSYMGLEAGQPLAGHKVDVVFLGSCTNSRYSDLEAAARVLDGKRVAPGVRMLVVPGSQQVKRRAEAAGLDEVFRAAGAEWREAGCSMCLAMNSDRVAPGEVAVSTSNRNFEGRQGPGGRTFLASPLTAAAAAIRGQITDVREIL